MTGCKNCDATCFQFISDGCVGYTGESFEGVPDGASIKAVIAELKKRIEYLEGLVDCDTCGGVQEISMPKTSLYGFGENRSTCSDKITNTNIKYTLVPGSTSTSVTYNLEDIINNLPKGYKVTKKQVRFYGQSGSNTVYTNSDKTVATFTFSPDKFPMNMEVLIMVYTPCGTVPVEKTIYLNSDLRGNYSGVGQISDYGKEQFAEVTQEDFNQAVKDRVLRTGREVESLLNPSVAGTEKVNIPQNADIETILQKLIVEVSDLKSNNS